MRHRQQGLSLGTGLVGPSGIPIELSQAPPAVSVPVGVRLHGSFEIVLDLVLFSRQEQAQRARGSLEQNPHHVQGAGVSRLQLQRAQEMILQVSHNQRGNLPERPEIDDFAAISGEIKVGFGAVLFQVQRPLGSLLSTLVPRQVAVGEPVAERQTRPRHLDVGNGGLRIERRRSLIKSNGAEEGVRKPLVGLRQTIPLLHQSLHGGRSNCQDWNRPRQDRGKYYADGHNARKTASKSLRATSFVFRISRSALSFFTRAALPAPFFT